MEQRELEYVDGKSSKFWRIELDGNRHTVTYGRRGTAGQSQTKDFATAGDATKSYQKLIHEKLAKGYVDMAADRDAASGESQSDGRLSPLAFPCTVRAVDLNDHVKNFAGKRVVDYRATKPPQDVGEQTIFRFRSDYDDNHYEESLGHFLVSSGAKVATGLVIGSWFSDDPSTSSEPVIATLVKNKDRLPQLNALFLGDIVQEESEMSWINQTDISPLLAAFPQLELLRVRGGTGLAISQPRHTKLRALALETGGMAVEVVQAVCASDFPNLEYLELWLGTSDYDGTSTVQDLQPILSGDLFPRLKYLGLRNCEYVDEIAKAIVTSPIVQRIETLDLSLGILRDDGAQALLKLPVGGTLKRLDIHHHFVGSDLIRKLKTLDLSVDVSEHQDEDEEYLFVAVGE